MIEKEKAYDEALKKASAAYKDGDRHIKATLERIFPELKASDEEKMRNFIINELACLRATNEKGSDRYEELTNAIDWLEKESKNSTDKPRFKVGDWVIFIKSKSIYQVEKKENYEYTLRHILGGSLCLSFSNEELIREWTIQDANNGDVLACNEEILLFKSYLAQERISLYCWYNGQTNNFHNKEVVDILMSKINKIHPATKEQRDLLFQKIREAGYKWNAKTKTLED